MNRKVGKIKPILVIDHALTPRQRQISRLVMRGCSNSEIAEQLGVCERTVKAYLAQIFRKFGIPIDGFASRVLLAVQLYEYGMRVEAA